MKRETMKFVHTSVGRVCYYSSEGSKGQATALLWPSLFTNGHANWELQLPTLHALGFRTIVVDPPGHGASGLPPPHFTIQQCADLALQILDKEGVQRAAFLGVSWGSFVCMRVAAMAPERVTSVVLSNTSAYRMSALVRFRDGLLASVVRIGFPGNLGKAVTAGLFGARIRKDNPAFIDTVVAQVNALNKVALSRAMRSVLVERADQSGDLQQIKAPTLVIAGTVDTAFPPKKHGERVAKGIAGSQYEVIADTGHVAPREAPSKFNALLQAFLGPATASI